MSQPSNSTVHLVSLQSRPISLPEYGTLCPKVEANTIQICANSEGCSTTSPHYSDMACVNGAISPFFCFVFFLVASVLAAVEVLNA